MQEKLPPLTQVAMMQAKDKGVVHNGISVRVFDFLFKLIVEGSATLIIKLPNLQSDTRYCHF